MTEEDRQEFVTAVLRASEKLSRMLGRLEQKIGQQLTLPLGCGPGDVCASALLMVLLGMLADEDEGRHQLKRAARMLASAPQVRLDEEDTSPVRKALDEIMSELRVKYSDHLWN